MRTLFRPNRHSRTGEAYKPDGKGRLQRHDRTVTVASGRLIDRNHITRAIEPRDWQKEIWSHYNANGELHFAAHWVASAASRCILYVGSAGERGAEPTPITADLDRDGVPDSDQDPNAEVALALLDSLYCGQLGQADMLRRMALHLTLVGETYLVGLDDPDAEAPETPNATGKARRWYVASNDELSVNKQGKSTFLLPDTGVRVNLTEENSLIIRIWSSHPQFGFEPDSAIRSTIPVLREIRGLSDHISANIDSRLAGAGILAIPQSATMPTPGASDAGGVQQVHEDPFTNALMTSMLTSIKDRDDAAAIVPTIIKVPDEAIDAIKHITLSTPLSENVSAMRESALDRFAAGADLPREVVTGTGSANHWSAWQLEEASVKLHIQPLVGVLCDVITQEYLWPMLRAAGIKNPTDYVIWYNSSELTQRPNKSSEAQTLWGLGTLSKEALLRENGFAPSDAPTDDEHAQWLAERMVLANPTLLPALSPFLGGLTSDALQGTPQVTVTEVPTGTEGEPTDARPIGPPGGTSGVIAAATGMAPPRTEHAWWLRTVEQVAIRALELAGKRMLGWARRGHRHWQNASRQVLPWDMYTVLAHHALDPTGPDLDHNLDTLLDGAFEAATVNFGADECVRATVETYCRHLLSTGQPHRREYLATWLSTRGCVPQLQE